MSLFTLARPLLFTLNAERAHGLTIYALSLMPLKHQSHVDSILMSTIAGVIFPSPIGLAAGFDKDGEVPAAMLALGFGSVEIGTLTPRPQPGNPKPRLFRLAEDEAVINRMGFNNGGQQAALARFARTKRSGGVIGINIGANKDSGDRIADYVSGVRAMASVASYLTINISSPNTPGLRGLQDKSELTALLDALEEARAPGGPPIFLKLAPDLDVAAIDDVVAAAIGKVDALIIGNTTISRPGLSSPNADEAGGLSGRPLATLARRRLSDFRKASGGTIPLIAVGGIADAEDAYARIKAGASLVQLYSALVYHGPGLARRITRELKALLIRDGFANVSDAVGVEA
jgi:dihydroorotate dehydrogenase